jgi:MoaA/NifB/PqqE/SkfB family radical SAM enzyme
MMKPDLIKKITSVRHKRRVFSYCLSKPAIIPAVARVLFGGGKLNYGDFEKGNFIAPPPTALNIFPTFRCNLKCIQCGQWGESGVFSSKQLSLSQDELDTAQWCSFIDQVAQFRPYLYFNGGEPLMREDLPDILKAAAARNLLTSFVSNCTLLEEKAEELVDADLFMFWGSIDGLGETNSKIRRGADFDRVIKGINRLAAVRDQKKKGVPLIKILTVIMPENQHQLLELANYFQRNLTLDIWAITPGVFTNTDLTDRNSQQYQEKLGIPEEYWQGYIRDVESMDCNAIEAQLEEIKNSKWKFSLELLPPFVSRNFSLENHYLQPQSFHEDVSSCWRAFRVPTIDPNGDVTCCQISHSFSAGNILEKDFLAIWNGEKYQTFRKAVYGDLFPCCARCTACYSYRGE